MKKFVKNRRSHSSLALWAYVFKMSSTVNCFSTPQIKSQLPNIYPRRKTFVNNSVKIRMSNADINSSDVVLDDSHGPSRESKYMFTPDGQLNLGQAIIDDTSEGLAEQNAAVAIKSPSVSIISSINDEVSLDALAMPISPSGELPSLPKTEESLDDNGITVDSSHISPSTLETESDEKVLMDNIDNIMAKASNSVEASVSTDIFAEINDKDLLDPTVLVNSVIGPALSNQGTAERSSYDEDATVHNDDTHTHSTSSLAEAIIESAISDPDTNGSIPIPNLRNDASLDEFKSNEVKVKGEEEVVAPDLKKILRFAIPAIGVWLCSPLLSLIDTSSVGLLSGTSQQAALNPAVAVTDYSALLAAFMYTATTNLIASARQTDDGVEGKPRTTRTFISAIQLSGLVGTGLGTVLLFGARFFLRTLIGNDAIGPEVFDSALRYVRIRALGMPAAVIIGSAQSACLGMQDIRSPLYVLLTAAIANFLGDIIFVGNTNPLIGGAAGAAWATVLSQYVALGLFLKWLTSKGKESPQHEPKVNLTDAILELTGKSKKGRSRRLQFRKDLREMSNTDGPLPQEHGKENKAKTLATKFNPFRQKIRRSADKRGDEKDTCSTRGFLAGKFTIKDTFKLPDKKSAKDFRPYVIPVTTTSVGRVSAYVAMGHVVSSSLGTLSMAANQIIVSVFYCLTPIADSLNLTAQSFIPALFEREKSVSRSKALKTARNNFIKAGSMFGAAIAGMVGTISLLGRFFTSDPLVISQVTSVIPILAGVFSVHGVICALEGLLLGQKDLNFLGKAYAFYFFAVPYFMLNLKELALAGKRVTLNSVWEVFFGYQIVRVSLWLLRSWQLQRKNGIESREISH